MFWDIVKRFPPIITSKQYQRLFEELELPISASRYLTFGVIIGILITILGMLLGIPYVGLIVFIGFLSYPYMIKKQEEQAILAQLPLFLIDLGSLINIGVPLLESIRIASNNTGRLQEVMNKVLKRVDKNESLSSVLLYLIQRYENETIKRAFTQLIGAIESGSGKELKQLGIELLKHQIHTIKEFGGRLSVITQFFISFNVILPVFIVLMIMALPIITQQQPSLELLNHSLFIIFPLLGIVFLVFAYLLFPETSFTSPSIDWRVLALGFGGMMTFYLVGLDEITGAGILLGLFTSSFIYYMMGAEKEKLIERLEKEVPEILLMLSAFPRFDLKEFFEYIAQSNLKVMKKIAKGALNIINTNQNPSEIFRYLKQFKSSLFSRFVSILEFSYQTGSSLGEKLAEWAEALYQYITAKKEIDAMFMVQKYTLIIGSVIVPTILGAMVRIFEQLFQINIAYIHPYVLMSSALIFALINLVSPIRIYWYFLMSGVGLVLFYLARGII